MSDEASNWGALGAAANSAPISTGACATDQDVARAHAAGQVQGAILGIAAGAGAYVVTEATKNNRG